MLNNSVSEIKPCSMLELETVLLEATKRLDIEMFKDFYIHTEDYKNSKRLFLLRDMAIAFNKFRELGDTYLEPNLGICNRFKKEHYLVTLVHYNREGKFFFSNLQFC